jgi:hypothetical protein
LLALADGLDQLQLGVVTLTLILLLGCLQPILKILNLHVQVLDLVLINFLLCLDIVPDSDVLSLGLVDLILQDLQLLCISLSDLIVLLFLHLLNLLAHPDRSVRNYFFEKRLNEHQYHNTQYEEPDL